MKLKVSQLEPNPFRNIKKYPIDRDKIQALKNSINETTFWDNILARKNSKGTYQIAYGHHRLIALKELKIDQIEIPVRDLDDATMIKIMANENMEQWQYNTAVINETISTTKNFLDSEIRKCKNLKELNAALGSIQVPNEQKFAELKTRGVRFEYIQKFLGGNWKKEIIQEALEALDGFESDDKYAIKKEVYEMAPSPGRLVMLENLLRNTKFHRQNKNNLLKKH